MFLNLGILSCFLNGFVVVPIHHTLSPSHIRIILDKVKPSVFLVMPEFLPLALSSLSSTENEKNEPKEKEGEKKGEKEKQGEKGKQGEKEEENGDHLVSIQNIIVWDTLNYSYTHFLTHQQSVLHFPTPSSPSLVIPPPPLYNYSYLVGVGGDGTISSRDALLRLEKAEEELKKVEDDQGSKREKKKKKEKKKEENKTKIVCYMFTSGSTGVPKGVILRNYMLCRQVFILFFNLIVVKLTESF